MAEHSQEIESMSNTMRCLSVRQPYAWAICVGVKTIENRVWKTDFRGEIAVHASQSPQYVNELRRSTKSKLFGKDEFALGAIIGTVEVVDVAPYGPAHESNSHATGPYCLVLKNAKLFKTPIPMKGKLNLFHLDPATTKLVNSSEIASVDFSPSSSAAQIANLMEPACDPAQSYECLIDSFWDKGEDEAIRVAADRLVNIQPANAHGYLVRFMFSDHDKYKMECLRDAQKMVELEPDSAMGYACLGWSLHVLGKNEEALVQLNHSLELSQDIPRAWYSRAEIHHALANFQNAITDCNRALEDEPHLYEALIVRGRSNLSIGNRSSAMEDADAALQLVPGLADAIDLKNRITAESA